MVWSWQFARLPMGVGVMDSVLHLPNLVFHEAGMFCSRRSAAS